MQQETERHVSWRRIGMLAMAVAIGTLVLALPFVVDRLAANATAADRNVTLASQGVTLVLPGRTLRIGAGSGASVLAIRRATIWLKLSVCHLVRIQTGMVRALDTLSSSATLGAVLALLPIGLLLVVRHLRARIARSAVARPGGSQFGGECVPANGRWGC